MELSEGGVCAQPERARSNVSLLPKRPPVMFSVRDFGGRILLLSGSNLATVTWVERGGDT